MIHINISRRPGFSETHASLFSEILTSIGIHCEMMEVTHERFPRVAQASPIFGHVTFPLSIIRFRHSASCMTHFPSVISRTMNEEY